MSIGATAHPSMFAIRTHSPTPFPPSQTPDPRGTSATVHHACTPMRHTGTTLHHV
jgi:hypothetical protein